MKTKNYFIVSLLSLSLIAVELGWTRIFSAEFFYTFAFLILSLAILGLGLGALAVRLFPGLKHNLAWTLSVTGLMIIAGPPVVFTLGLEFSKLLIDWSMILRFLAIIIILSSSFFAGGIALAIIFKTNHENISRLYTSDLIGAGLGVAFTMIAMNILGTPITVLWSAIPVLIAALICHKRYAKVVPLIAFLAMIFLSPYADSLLESDRKEPAEVLYKHWDAMAKIKIYDYNGEYRRINIDNAANTGVNKFDGNWDRPDSLKFGFQIVGQLIGKFPECTFLSLGAGGGQDVFQALQFGAAEIHAVEVNTHINELMLNGELAEFSGHIYNDPRVIVVSEDARAYVRRFEQKFDIIYSFSSNSYAALASGAFSLAENYIYTTEAFRDYWNALTPDGFLLLEHHFYVPRLVSEVLDALKRMNIPAPESHLAVYELPNMRRKMLLLGKQPLSRVLIDSAFAGIASNNPEFAQTLYPPADSLRENMVHRIIRDGWQSWQDSVLVNISPSTDDKPFIAQMGLWRNFDLDKLQKMRGYEDSLGFPLSLSIIVVTILLVLLLVLPLNLIPYLRSGDKLSVPAWLYFFTIGMAFMMLEISYIQKYTLLIGPSVYSIITTLLTLLIFSGIGSYFAGRLNNRFVFGGIFIWILLDIFLFPQLTYNLAGLTMFWRVLITAVLIAPAGVLMGMPFPMGGQKVKDLIDWGFAVNGAASVLGSCLIVLVAFAFGISWAQGTGAFLYLIAFWLLQNTPSR